MKVAAGWAMSRKLVEPIIEVEGSGVIVTWVEPDRSVDLFERGINESQAADLRNRLSTFAQDWDNPEMNIYDESPLRSESIWPAPDTGAECPFWLIARTENVLVCYWIQSLCQTTLPRSMLPTLTV